MKLDPNRFKGQQVVITGGSSGIGLAIAEEFAKLGAHVSLIARNDQKLIEVKQSLQKRFPQIEVHIYSADVADADSITKVITTIGLKNGIFGLILNAGIGGCGRFEDMETQTLQHVMDVNYWGSVYTLQAALPYLKQTKGGHIGFVSSVGGYLGAIGYSSYAPSKFAVTGLAECIRMEASDYGVGTTIVFPPDTDTPLWHWEQEHTLPECKALSKSAKLMKPEAVAQKFVKGIVKNKFEVICNTESRAIRWMKVNLPGTYFNMLDGIVKKDRKERAKAADVAPVAPKEKVNV